MVIPRGFVTSILFVIFIIILFYLSIIFIYYTNFPRVVNVILPISQYTITNLSGAWPEQATIEFQHFLFIGGLFWLKQFCPFLLTVL